MQLLRRIFPVEYPCPKCKGMDYAIHSHRGNLQYRTCAAVGCGETFKVYAQAAHVKGPDGRPSRVVLIDGSMSF